MSDKLNPTAYTVHRVVDYDCSDIDRSVVIAKTDDLPAAWKAAHASDHEFGAAVLDTRNGRIDFGGGFRWAT